MSDDLRVLRVGQGRGEAAVRCRLELRTYKNESAGGTDVNEQGSVAKGGKGGCEEDIRSAGCVLG